MGTPRETEKKSEQTAITGSVRWNNFVILRRQMLNANSQCEAVRTVFRHLLCTFRFSQGHGSIAAEGVLCFRDRIEQLHHCEADSSRGQRRVSVMFVRALCGKLRARISDNLGQYKAAATTLGASRVSPPFVAIVRSAASFSSKFVSGRRCAATTARHIKR
eukprot:COSAG03_NODE_1664_length_3699_cov_2.498889_1_plen_160_part_10